MRQLINLRSILAAAALAAGLAVTTSASAGGCHTPRCYYKTVITWKIVEEPCYDYVTRYDHCGKPYQDVVVTYKTVKVPVEKLVKVCY
ncbi:MAG: hypothetical protein KDA75_19710 [Planctomycetaceae bacterium]|nr:hypothetical protein [Planctomycetaceae bacterium]